MKPTDNSLTNIKRPRPKLKFNEKDADFIYKNLTLELLEETFNEVASEFFEQAKSSGDHVMVYTAGVYEQMKLDNQHKRYDLEEIQNYHTQIDNFIDE